ncbi:hypothetical protein LVJ94_34400 [Pendulispora rubella]|uniref:Uncharacterized protein n=1 Tax=Pendulispora rubella TaxID=2741070 RepID=A0ABZ2KYE0_9BACT
MSEYQCHEFIALDRPLTAQQMKDLRAISTRAEITSTRFKNEYHWGDLKAKPEKLVERYFDAYMYFANWGTHRLMLRIPAKGLEPNGLRAYFTGNAARARRAGAHLILDLHSEDEEPDYYYEEDSVSLAAIAPIRAELLRGDTRPAYLAWLLAVQMGDVDDDAMEPPVRDGLSNLTAAQSALVEFLRVDADLLAAAATATAEGDDETAFRAWVMGLDPRAKDEWLARAVDDPELALGAALHREFRKQKPKRRPGRRVGDLCAKAKEIRSNREQAEALAKQKKKDAAAKARTKQLDTRAKGKNRRGTGSKR